MKLYRVFICDVAVMFKCLRTSFVPTHARTRTNARACARSQLHLLTNRYYRPFGMRAGYISFPTNRGIAPARYIIVSDRKKGDDERDDESKVHINFALSGQLCECWCYAKALSKSILVMAGERGSNEDL